MYVCMYVCMYACMYACMHVCVYIYIYIHIHSIMTITSLLFRFMHLVMRIVLFSPFFVTPPGASRT